MRRSSTCQIILLSLLLIHLTASSSVLNSRAGEPNVRCREAERQALIKFRDDFDVAGGNVLSEWGEEEEKRECCDWIGIRCDNRTGHVVRLDLSPSASNRSCELIGPGTNEVIYGGNISSSLVNLQHLNYLDLCCVSFYYLNTIPSFIGSLRELRYLNLSYTRLGGEIPPQLGNLSSLQYLDLADTFKADKSLTNMEWISRLSALQFLDLSYTDMGLATDWERVVNNLPHLKDLRLKQCHLPDTVFSSHSLVNSSKVLAVLDLSSNFYLSSSVYKWLSNYSHSLVHLDLSSSVLKNSTLKAFENMVSLEYLDLYQNHFGPIPDSFGINMTSIKFLYLSNTALEGSIPEAFGNMTSLEELYLGSNMLEGEIPKSIWEICTLRVFSAPDNNIGGPIQFAESLSGCAHSSLEHVELDHNRIIGSLPNFTLYPSLIWLILSSNQLNGSISKTIGQLSQLIVLDISENFISDVMSEAHLSKLFDLLRLDLSHNSNVTLDIASDWVPPFHQLQDLIVPSCKLSTPNFPKWIRPLKNCTQIDFSNAGISGPIPNWLWNFSMDINTINLSNNEITEIGLVNEMSPLLRLDLSSNLIGGPIPPSILINVSWLQLSRNQFTKLNHMYCNASTRLQFLDVSFNELSGELPNCWSNMEELEALILTNNKLSGKIPTSFGFLSVIKALHLSNNNFTGELPSSLKNCTELMALDAGGNELSGNIPAWIGQSLTSLVIVSLRANSFYGNISSQLCTLANLQLLDLSLNNLSSTVPKCLGNIEGMKVYKFTDLAFSNETMFLMWKGVVSEFKNLKLLKNVDLSSNQLVGEIPADITNLTGLVSMNLSRNNLSGEIPREIGQLKSLDALDLSNNNLSGRIPSSLSQVDRLSILDLSNNHLSGKIPAGPQLQTRSAAAYLGNSELCGDPLPKCPSKEETPISKPANEDSDHKEDQDRFITGGFYTCLAVGFVLGFWGFCCTLIFKKSWRYGYFKLLNDVGDWIYVATTIYKAKLLRLISG